MIRVGSAPSAIINNGIMRPGVTIYSELKKEDL
jgi:hypothetical protein